MGKNDKEKNLLQEWGTQNNVKYCFTDIDKERKSYFISREGNETPYIREYGFETLPELTKELDSLWGGDLGEIMAQIKKIIGIAVLKNKPGKVISSEVKESTHEIKKETEDRLPAFIYNF